MPAAMPASAATAIDSLKGREWAAITVSPATIAALTMPRSRSIGMVIAMKASGAANSRRHDGGTPAPIRMPASTRSDISMAARGGMPLATIATPAMMPKATTPRRTGSAARAPATKLLLCAMLADAAQQVLARLALAGFAQLRAARGTLRHLG